VTYRNKRLICVDCMNGFTLTAEEQAVGAPEGPTGAPSRCPECRASREALRTARAAAPPAVSKRRY
jgi:hypothetical protein